MKKLDKFITKAKSAANDASREETITIILLAENYGYRMKSYGPLSLISLDGKTLLEHQIEAIRSVFINSEIIICTGFETSKIYHFIQSNFPSSYNIRIVENQIYYHSNCCEGLRLCMNNTMNNKILICGGGVMLTREYLKTLNLRKSSILTQKPRRENTFDIGVITNESRLETMSLAVRDNIWTELLYITGDPLVKSFYNVISKPELKNKFLFEAINLWKGRRQLMISENSVEPIFKIDNIKTFKRITDENFVSQL
jgi:CTP:phosphocholine cytidylyltransferase-like protein